MVEDLCRSLDEVMITAVKLLLEQIFKYLLVDVNPNRGQKKQEVEEDEGYGTE